MIKRILFLLLLAGCGGYDPASDNYGYGFHFDEESPVTGIRVRYANDFLQMSLADLDREYQTISDCSGIPLVFPGPLVLFEFGVIEQWDSNARYLELTKTILLDSRLEELARANLAVRHEFLHFLLHMTTGNSDGDHNSHPAWELCVPGSF